MIDSDSKKQNATPSETESNGSPSQQELSTHQPNEQIIEIFADQTNEPPKNMEPPIKQKKIKKTMSLRTRILFVKILNVLSHWTCILAIFALGVCVHTIGYMIILTFEVIPQLDLEHPYKGCEYFVESSKGAVAITWSGSSVFFYSILTLVGLTLLLCLRVKDNFGLIKMNFISLFLRMILLIGYVSYTITQTMFEPVQWVSWNIYQSGEIPYTIFWIDMILVANLTIIRTYFWNHDKYKSVSDSTYNGDLEYVLSTRENKKKFENYMKKDFIVENILYHNTLIKMKSINPANIKKRIRMVKNIYEQYIDTNGSLALNLEGSQLSHIKQLLEEQEMSTPTLEQIEQYYENEIMTQVKHNIKDVFMRFTKTKEGSKIMKQKDKDKEWDKV